MLFNFSHDERFTPSRPLSLTTLSTFAFYFKLKSKKAQHNRSLMMNSEAVSKTSDSFVVQKHSLPQFTHALNRVKGFFIVSMCALR